MVTHDQLIAALNAEWPDLVHGIDFWVGQPMDGKKQLNHAFIVEWKADNINKPDEDAVEALIVKHQSVLDELEKRVLVPETVTMAQARIALARDGLIDDVSQGLKALPDDPEKDKALTAWEYAPNVSRNGVLVKTLGAELGFTEAELDKIFIAAAKIEL